MSSNDQQQKLDEALAKAALDIDFRERLIADPVEALAGEGIEIPDGLSIKLVEVSSAKMVVALPPIENEPMSDAALEAVDGGFTSKGKYGLYMLGDNELFELQLPPIQPQSTNRGWL